MHNNKKNILLKPGSTDLVPCRISFVLWGEGASLALIGNLSRHGVSIKITVWRHLKRNSQFTSELYLQII